MIPRIANVSKIDTNYEKYLRTLVREGFTGDVASGYADRTLVATDNSVYQRTPQGVVFPKTKEDVVKIFKLASLPSFSKLALTPRGGGTGTNGQALNRGIIIDLSRYMRAFHDINESERTVWVEPGVIKDELNEVCSAYGLFFSPELSTSSRATIGGMISNDAAGQGSLKYGRTSEHILELEVVLCDGTLATFKPIKGAEIEHYCQKPGLEGEIYRECYDLLKHHADEIKAHFPKLNRFLTGYDLAHAYDKDSDTLNLVRLVCGAEGTLCTVVGAKLDLTPKPAFRGLCVIKYEDFDSALRHANELIASGAFSVETVDSKVLGLAKKDPVWLSVQQYIQEVPDFNIEGVNIVEFCGSDIEREQRHLEDLHNSINYMVQRSIEQESPSIRHGIIGAQLATTKEAIAAVYGMRKKAVGLLGSASGSKKLVAFTEDTVVPPEHLADYIQEFRALLDSMDVEYGMFGHVDTGLMHVRPALDLTLDADKQKLVTISDRVVELVKKYGGQMWGEHGRGYRSVYGEQFFGELYPLARRIKAFFDINNRLNPGKICVPFGNESDQLVGVDSPMRGDLDRTIDLKTRQVFEGAMNCNGNGQCFSYSKASLMCPSYRYTNNRVNSPKGYAGLMRQWLSLMEARGADIAECEQQTLRDAGAYIPSFTINELGEREYSSESRSWMQQVGADCARWIRYGANLFRRTYNTIFEKEDFNHEYLGYVATCLSCKSCQTQCPAHVNAAELNSRFLNFYYSRYLRPRMDFLTLSAESNLPLMAHFPKLSNAVLHSEISQFLVKRLFNMVDLPHFASKTLGQQAREQDIPVLSFKQALRKSDDFDVLVISDSFTASFEADGLVELAQLAQFLGFRVGILKPYINGKLYVIRGARGKFIRKASKQAKRLARLHNLGLKLVGFDPALTICYRDEYRELLPNCPEFRVLLPEEWLKEAMASASFISREAELKERLQKFLDAELVREKEEQERLREEDTLPSYNLNPERIAKCSMVKDFYLFCHCTEQALVPLSVRMWQEVMERFGLTLVPVPVACCGMAGLFGHMVPNLVESRTVYDQNWREALMARDFEQCLVTGFSCRSQVHRMEYMRANHPIHVLHTLMKSIQEQQ